MKPVLALLLLPFALAVPLAADHPQRGLLTFQADFDSDLGFDLNNIDNDISAKSDAFQSTVDKVAGHVYEMKEEADHLVDRVDHLIPKLPLPHPPILDYSDKTVGQILNETLHDSTLPPHVLPLKRLAYLINATAPVNLTDALYDASATLTFFAPDDAALTPPKHDHEHHEQSGKDHPFHSEDVLHTVQRGPECDKKEFFKKLIGWILQYHLVDSGAFGKELADKSTIASALYDVRIRIEPKLLPAPSLGLNIFSHTKGPIIKAKNGYIYLIDHPLLPAGPVLDELFLFPSVFSTFTSGVQKVDLNVHTFLSELEASHALDEAVPLVVTQLLQELVTEHGLTQYTIFAPTNAAFRKLGLKLNAFLFSPFGKRILKDVLSYHIIKDVEFFSDFNVNATAVQSRSTGSVTQPEAWAHTRPSRELRHAGIAESTHMERYYLGHAADTAVKVTQYHLHTLFNQTVLPVDVYEYHAGLLGKGPLRRSIWVGSGQGHKPGSRVKAVVPDVVALKGAIHVVDSLIRPPFEHVRDEHKHLLRQWDAQATRHRAKKSKA